MVITAIVFASYLGWLIAFDWIDRRRQRDLEAHIQQALDIADGDAQ